MMTLIYLQVYLFICFCSHFWKNLYQILIHQLINSLKIKQTSKYGKWSQTFCDLGKEKKNKFLFIKNRLGVFFSFFFPPQNAECSVFVFVSLFIYLVSQMFRLSWLTFPWFDVSVFLFCEKPHRRLQHLFLWETTWIFLLVLKNFQIDPPADWLLNLG